MTNEQIEDDDAPHCEGCGRGIKAGERFLQGSEVAVCAECAPQISDILDENDETWVDEDGETMSTQQRRALYDDLIAKGLRPTDKYLPDVMEDAQ